MKKIPLIALLLFTLCDKSIGQVNTIPQEPVTLPTPNVAALQMYGEIPVSKFTGVPDIEVPLYTLKEKEITVPISLSYHASGFRPDQHPGWVGSGWSLQGGGAISRIVHNLPDEDDELLSTDQQPIGFLFRHTAIAASNWSSPAFMTNVAEAGINYVVDEEPDEFDFTFAGHSGKFFMDENGVYRAEGDKGIQITLFNATNPLISCPLPLDSKAAGNPFIDSYMHCFSGFIITTTDGTQYIFGGTGDAIEYSKDFYNQGVTTWIADSWHLTKIIGPDGSQVVFSYQRGQLIDQLTFSMYFKSTSTAPTSPTAWYNFWSLTPPSCSTFSNPLAQGVLPFGGKLMSPVYLSQISSEQATINIGISPTTELRYPISVVYPPGLPYAADANGINFYTSDKFYDLYLGHYGDGTAGYPDVLTSSLIWSELDNIKIIKNDNQQLIKQFNFTYSHNANTRLTLLSLQEQSATGSLIPPYQFFYDQSKLLPGYFVNENDHWGFWNGRQQAVVVNSNGQLINPVGYFSLRQPDSNYVRAGVLNKIIYPTGGAAAFTYEPNTYGSEVDVQRWNPIISDITDQPAGGLRIRKIVTGDVNFPGEQVTKEYFYFQNYTPATGLTGRSSGVLGGKAQYYWPNYTITSGGQTTSITAFSTQSVLPASENSMGSHIGYGEVEERNSDGSITDYQYTNFNANPANNDGGHLDDQYITNLQPNASPYVSFNSKGLERGKELSETVYSATGVLLKKMKYTYNVQATNPIRSLRVNKIFTCNTGTLSYDEGTAYNFYVYPYLPTAVTSVLYDENGLNPQTVSKNTSYEGQHSLPSLETFTNSKMQLVSTYYRYPFDLIGTISNPTIAQPLSLLVYKNMIGSPIETIHTKFINSNEMVTSAIVKTFKGYSVTPPSGIAQLTVKPAVDYYFESSSPMLKSAYINYNLTPINNAGPPEQYQIDPNLKPRVEYANFDTRGNIVQFNDKAAVTGPSPYFAHYNSYLWGYNKLFPIAKITNSGNSSLTTEFYAENFEESTANGVTADGTAHTGSKYMHSANFLVNWTAPNSRSYVLSYWYKSGGIWQYSGEIPYVGTTYTVMKGDGAYDDLRIYPADAQMSTYTYASLIGMTSSIDSKGETTYYDYDDFQRLLDIKDIDVVSKAPTIIKSYAYNYSNGSLNETANWQDDNHKSCELDANGNFDGVQLQEQIDNNILSPTYGNTKNRTLGANGACLVTLSFTVTNNGSSGITASFYGGPENISVDIPVPSGSNVTIGHIPIYSNYTLSLSPSGSGVNRTFILGNHTIPPAAPGATFTGVNITAGSADLSLIIN